MMRSSGYLNLIVGITGNVMDGDVSEYLISGANLVLSKPVKSHVLKILIRHIQLHGSLSRAGFYTHCY
jgi:CheY-like chemotaxis protein